VARVLIVEPHPDIRTLFAVVVARAGHEPVLDIEDGGVEVDAAVIEPGDDEGLACARRLRAVGLPVVFVSIFPADRATLELEPVAYFVKPFALAELEQALDAALAQEKAA
jgi:DNA-binding response OmpR family regulator